MSKERLASVTIKSQQGLHARPATAIAQLLKKYSSQVRLDCGENSADGRSVLEMLMLAAKEGARIDLRVTGEDADEALNALIQAFDSGLEEAR